MCSKIGYIRLLLFYSDGKLFFCETKLERYTRAFTIIMYTAKSLTKNIINVQYYNKILNRSVRVGSDRWRESRWRYHRRRCRGAVRVLDDAGRSSAAQRQHDDARQAARRVPHTFTGRPSPCVVVVP